MTETVPQSDPAMVQANGVELCYQTFGSVGDPPLLLIMGLGAQMIAWDDAFCEQLAGRGFYVIRYDNRDVGKSTTFDAAGTPDVLTLWQGTADRQTVPYTVRDMADDAAGLLAALGIDAAHVVGASLGGMIAQLLAIHHPQRVRTLTSIMSAPGKLDQFPPEPEAMALLMRPAATERDAYVEDALVSAGVLGGSGYPLDEERARRRAAQAFDRGINPAGTARQLAAILVTGSWKEALPQVSAPTLVIHGDDDPLVPVQGGVATAEAIPDAELVIVEGMGHDLPPPAWPQVVGAIAGHAQRREPSLPLNKGV